MLHLNKILFLLQIIKSNTTGTTVDTARVIEIEDDQRTPTWKRSGERNVDSKFQVQLEEDGGGSTRQSWMETSGLWPTLHQSTGSKRLMSSKSIQRNYRITACS